MNKDIHVPALFTFKYAEVGVRSPFKVSLLPYYPL